MSVYQLKMYGVEGITNPQQVMHLVHPTIYVTSALEI